MFITRKHLPRRTVLQGVGAAVGLPLLDAMVPAATAMAKTAANPAPRFGFVYFPHGSIMERWTPEQSGTQFDLPQILQPFEAYRDQMTIVSGLRNRAGEVAGPHAAKAGTWLNCVTPALSHSPQAGVSADQVAARQIGQDTPFPSLELCTEPGGPCDPGYGCSYGYTVSFRTPTQPLPMEYNPRKLFYDLFGRGDTPAERDLIVAETRSVLDSIAGEAAAIQRTLGPQDRLMVSAYLDSVREIERRIQTMEARDVSSLELPEAPVGVPNDFTEHLDLMFSLMALAYQSNMTRVITFMMGKEVSMRTFNNVGVSDAFHPLSHHGNSAANIDRMATVCTFHSEMYGRFLKRMADTPDGDGSLLDHSIMLYGSGMSDGNRHNCDPLPAVVFGRGYGRIRGGQHLAYPQDTPQANLLLTLLERGGVSVEALGDSNGELAGI